MEILTEVEAIVTDVNRYRFDVCMITLDDQVLEGLATGTDAAGFTAIIREPIDSEGNSNILVDLGDFGSLRAAKAAVRRWAIRNQGGIQWIL